ncbi:MAG: phytoene synthase [Myxococcales bacterium]|nr:phytoene synthase [Myxococcales bacterium]|tara:strand:- start:9009 stop:9926 length:918 start_codon:yes stop_codon:yes gene_type:complete
MSEALVDNQAILKKHGRSFYWASVFLPADTRDRAASLYGFCRRVDDAVDEAPSEDVANRNIIEMEQLLVVQKNGENEFSALFNELRQCGLGMEPAQQLLLGVKSDLEEVKVRDEEELLLYCYRVAGTVGLMMCPVLNVREPTAWGYAIDLGIGMQLTNICRDVLEDAKNQRVYLPQSWFQQPLTVDDITSNHERSNEISSNVLKALRIAESHYNSAIEGLVFIPSRTRLAICIALTLYREIGRKIEKHWSGNSLKGRMFVSGPEKIICVARGIGLFIKTLFSRKPTKNQSVAKTHHVLTAMPGVS